MTSGSYDFAGYQVLVVGGTRGEGHTIATAFAEAGASVTVTGTMMLRELYDTDLSPFDYESVNLARQDSIDHLAGDGRPPRRAGPRRLGQPPLRPAARRAGVHRPGGPLRPARADVPHHAAAPQAQPEPRPRWWLRGQHRRRTHVAGAVEHGRRGAGAGHRVHRTRRREVGRARRPGQLGAPDHPPGASPPVRPARRQPGGRHHAPARAGHRAGEPVAASALFLASSAASRITGQTLRLG